MRLGLAILLLLAASACGEVENSSAGASATVTVTETVTAAAEPSDRPSDPPSFDDPLVARFGEAIEFENGLRVIVNAPRRYTPSPDADLDGGPLPKRGVPVRFRLTLVNGGTTAIGPDLPLITVTSDGEELQPVGLSDSSYGIDGLARESRVLAGKRSISEMAYFVLDPKDVTVDVAIGGYDTLTFSSAGG